MPYVGWWIDEWKSKLQGGRIVWIMFSVSRDERPNWRWRKEGWRSSLIERVVRAMDILRIRSWRPLLREQWCWKNGRPPGWTEMLDKTVEISVPEVPVRTAVSPFRRMVHQTRLSTDAWNKCNDSVLDVVRTPDVVVRRYVGFHPQKTIVEKPVDLSNGKKFRGKSWKRFSVRLLMFLGDESLHSIGPQVVV